MTKLKRFATRYQLFFRCTGRDFLVGTDHPFSFVLTIEQNHSVEIDGNSLYDNLELENTVEAIAQATLQAEV